MKITPIVVNAFIKYLKELTIEQGVDPAIIGFQTISPEEVKRFLEEHCKDLETSECKSKILDMYPALSYVKEADREALRFAEMELSHEYGTSYISEAFKKLTQKYSYTELMDMLMDIQGTELEIFRDYVIGKWGASDIDIRRLHEVIVYGVKAMEIRYGSPQLFLKQSLQAFNLKMAKKIEQFIAHGDCIRIAHKDKNTLILIAIFDSVENVIMPVTQSTSIPMVVLNYCNKRGALII